MNKANNKKIFVTTVSFILLIIFLVLFLYLIGAIRDSKSIETGNKLIFIKDNINIKTSDNKEMLVNLPKKFKENLTYSYSFIPRKVERDKPLFMFIKNSYQTYELKYNDEIIYQKVNPKRNFLISGGDAVRVVHIPDKYIGKELTISFQAIKNSTYGILIPYLILGSQSELIINSYITDLDILIIAVILAVFSIEAFIMQLFLLLYKKSHSSAFIASLYAMVLAVYIVIRTPTMYFLIPRGTVLYILDYILFLLLPLTISIFLLNVIKKKGERKTNQRVIEFIISLFIVHMMIEMVLVLCGYIEFIDTQKLSQIAVVSVALINTIIPFTIDDFEFKKILSIAMATFMIVLVIFLLVYITSYRIRYMTMLGSIGGLFILFQSLITMKMYSNNYMVSYKVMLNKNLALTDNLTRLLNRNAFEEDMKHIEKNGQKIFLMILDINNLKEINDEFGHNTGDYIIENVADILQKMKQHFIKLTPYRMGGDEFIAMAFDMDEDYIDKMVHFINKKSKEFQDRKPELPFDFAMAYDTAIINYDFNMDEFIKKVDKKMYEDKKLKKEKKSTNF